MRNLLKLKVIFLVFIILFNTQANAADRILPLAKPIVDKDTKERLQKRKKYTHKKNQRTRKIKKKSRQLQNKRK